MFDIFQGSFVTEFQDHTLNSGSVPPTSRIHMTALLQLFKQGT
jgi:hypothetical protein